MRDPVLDKKILKYITCLGEIHTVLFSSHLLVIRIEQIHVMVIFFCILGLPTNFIQHIKSVA